MEPPKVKGGVFVVFVFPEDFSVVSRLLIRGHPGGK